MKKNRRHALPRCRFEKISRRDPCILEESDTNDITFFLLYSRYKLLYLFLRFTFQREINRRNEIDAYGVLQQVRLFVRALIGRAVSFREGLQP